MDVLLRGDRTFIINDKSCTTEVSVDKSTFFSNPKIVFNFKDGSTPVTCVYSIVNSTYTWEGSITNGDLQYNGSSWVIYNYTK